MLGTGIGGALSNLRKLEGGGETFESAKAPDIDPSYRDSIENPKLGVKSPSLRGATFGASSPPPPKVC